MNGQEIKANQVAYYADAQKIAIVPGAETGSFALVDAQTGKEVFTADLPEKARNWRPSGDSFKVADFSAFTQEGTYVIRTGSASSYPFTIKNKEAYTPLLKGTLKSFYFWRASTDIPPEFGTSPGSATTDNFSRAAGHPDDQVLIHESAASPERPEGTVISSAKGWYDAGDYNKYVVNAGVSVFFLAHALELCPDLFARLEAGIPESGNGIPDILNELKWEYDWLLTMQDRDGGIYFKVSSKSFDRFEMPSEDHATRYAIGKSTASTLDFAAMAALGYRIFRPYAAQFPGYADACLSAAEKAWAWAKANPAVPFKNPPDIHTGEYGDNNFKDEFFWAAAELFISTGKADYWKELDFEQNFTAPNWGNVCSNGLLSLALHQNSLNPAADKKTISGKYQALVGKLWTDFNISPFGVSITDFGWGSNGDVASRAAVLVDGFFLLKDRKYLIAGMEGLNYLLGKNATGYSFVTGFGHKSPLHIHDRRSSSDGIAAPIPGYLAGGPNGGANGDSGSASYPSKSPAKRYLDVIDSYSTNEIAINWNAPLVCLIGLIEGAQRR